MSLGPDSLQFAVRTMDWKTRFFFGLLGISECNAYLAHCASQRTNGQPELTRVEWKKEIAKALVSNPYDQGPSRRNNREEEEVKTVNSILGDHAYVVSTPKDARVCSVCSKYASDGDYQKRTVFKCKCGARVCNPALTNRMCHIVHLLKCVSVEQWEEARAHVAGDSFDPIKEAKSREEAQVTLPSASKGKERKS